MVAPRPPRSRHVSPLTVLIAVAALLRLPLLLVPGYAYDMLIFREWAVTAGQQGLLAAIHRPEFNYVGYAYVLGAIGWLRDILGNPADLARDPVLLALMKVPGVLADLGVALVLYRLPRHLLPETHEAPGRIAWPRPVARLPLDRQLGLAAAALYLFNPATLYTSGYWGQVDSLVALAMLGSLLLLVNGRPAAAGAVLALGFLIKPQPVVLVPVLVWVAWRWQGWRGVARGVGGGLAAMALGLAYFAVEGALPRIREIYEGLFETGTQISVSAMNLWWIVYRVSEDVQPHHVALTILDVPVTVSRLSLALVAGAGALLIVALGRRPSVTKALLGGAFIVLCFYVLPMKMHERYLFPLFALLAPVAVLHARWLAMYVALSVTYTLNLYAVLPVPPPADQTQWGFGAPLDVAVSIANVALLGVFAAMFLAERRVRPDLAATAVVTAEGAGAPRRERVARHPRHAPGRTPT